MASKEIEDLLERKRELDIKLKQHAASMGGTRLRRKQKTVATLLTQLDKVEGGNLSQPEAEKKVTEEPVETVYELTQTALAMADKIMESKGVQDMMSAPLTSKIVKTKSKRKKKTTSDKPANTNTPPKPTEEKKSAIRAEPQVPSAIPENITDDEAPRPLEEIAGDLYSFVVENRKEDVKQHKKDKSYRKSLDKTKEKRTKQLIGLFKVKRKKEPEKELKKKEGETPKEGKEPPKTNVQTPSTPSTPGSTATQVSRPSIVSPAVKAVTGIGLGVAAASAIGGAESGGAYNITYGDKLDKQKNVVRGPNMSPEQRFGKDLTELTLEEVDILGKERNRNSRNTSAMGKYQFMNTTLFGYKDKSGVLRPGLVQRLNLDMKTTKFTPEVQEKIYALFRQDNQNELKRLGVPPTPGYEYMAHYLGPGGAKAVYDRRNTNMTVQQALVDAGKPDPVNGKVNEELTRIRAADFESVLEGRLKSHGLNPHAEAKSSVPAPTPASVDRTPVPPQQRKESNNTSSPSATVLNTTTNNVNGGTQINVSKREQNDGAKILEKQYN